jgi:hypothetical protein
MEITKLQLAQIQLRRAIQLFNAGDFICAITLGGAANEILSVFAEKRQGHSTTDHDKWFWDGMAESLNKNKPSKGKIVQVNNRIKNSLKHHNTKENTIIEADFKFEAQEQIDKAIRNYWIALKEPPKDRIINNYVNWYWT